MMKSSAEHVCLTPLHGLSAERQFSSAWETNQSTCYPKKYSDLVLGGTT
jgi:hypothetical protein